jgi:ribosomal protein L16 Arg81 hydroxylase
MIEFPFSVAHLLEPVSIATFLSRYHERELLIVNRNSPSHYGDLLTIEALDDIICATALTSDDIIVVNESRAIQPEDYLRDDETVDSVRVQQLFDEGATISLRQVQNRVPSLARLCNSAAQHFNCAFQVNMYFTPANAQGFRTHHDTHDVFILQLMGSKNWRAYQPAMSLPLRGQRYFWKAPPLDSVMKEFALSPGDLFYCPRGYPHDARSVQEASVHISLGALVNTWTEWLLEIVADVALRDPAFRAALPPDYATCGVAPEVLDLTLQNLLRRVQRRARSQHVLDMMAERFIYHHPTLMLGQRATLRAASSLTLDSTVGGRPGLLYRLTERRNKLILLSNARRMTLPKFTAPSLEFALSSSAFLIRDLPGSLTDSGKLVFIRRLMREGLVVAVRE